MTQQVILHQRGYHYPLGLLMFWSSAFASTFQNMRNGNHRLKNVLTLGRPWPNHKMKGIKLGWQIQFKDLFLTRNDRAMWVRQGRSPRIVLASTYISVINRILVCQCGGRCRWWKVQTCTPQTKLIGSAPDHPWCAWPATSTTSSCRGR